MSNKLRDATMARRSTTDSTSSWEADWVRAGKTRGNDLTTREKKKSNRNKRYQKKVVGPERFAARVIRWGCRNK